MRDCFAPNPSSFGRVQVEDSEHMEDVVKELGGRCCGRRLNRLVVTVWDTGIVRKRKPDSTIHRLVELDRGSGSERVGDGPSSSGLNLRLTEVIPEITVGEYNLPFPFGEAGAPTGESLKHSDRTLIWMVDAQTALGAADAGGILIGSNSSHERAAKTGRFVDTTHAFDARSLNTWEENSAPVDVCIHEPGSSANRVPGGVEKIC